MCARLVSLFVLFLSYWRRNVLLGNRWTGQNNGEGWTILRLCLCFICLPTEHSISLHKTQMNRYMKNMRKNCWSIYLNSTLPQFRSVTQLCPTLRNPWTAAHQASLSITNSWSSPKLMCIKLVMPSSHLILCHPLLFLPQSLPASESFPMSQIMSWPRYRSFSFSISPSNEHPGTGLL